MSSTVSGVMILHGFTASLDTVRELFEPLRTLGIRVATPVLRGHGAQSYEQLRGVGWKEWLADAERELKITAGTSGRVVVVGHSMGALLALHLAAGFPDLVDSLILATPPLRLFSWFAPGRPLEFLALPVSRLVDTWPMETPLVDSRTALKPANYERAPTDSIISFFDLVKKTSQVLGRVTVPVLVIHCRKETIVLPESADVVMHGILTPPENKQLIWLEHSGHQVFCDCESDVAVRAVVGHVSNRLACSSVSGVFQP